MPNSLRCRLKKLNHKGLLTNRELERLVNALNIVNHIEDIKADIKKKHFSIIEGNDFDFGRTYGYEECLEIIDKHTKGVI